MEVAGDIAANVPTPFKRVYSETERQSGTGIVEKDEPSTNFNLSRRVEHVTCLHVLFCLL